MRSLHDIDLKLLRNFRAIADAGSLVAAQAALNVSQSTLSTQLSDLETRLGFRLCQRGRGGFALTPEGQQVLAALEDLFAAADRFQNATATISGDMRGVLRVGIMDAMLNNSAWPLPEVLGRFSTKALQTHVDLALVSPAVMEEQLHSGKRDAVIGPFPEKRSGLSYVPLFQERHSLYAAAHHPLATEGTIGFEALSRHALIVTAGELRRFPFIRRKPDAHGDTGNIHPAATVDQMETHAILIRSGRFVGFLPDYFGASLADLSRLPTGPDLQYLSPIYLAYRTQSAPSLILRRFIEEVRQQPLLSDSLVATGAVVPLDR